MGQYLHLFDTVAEFEAAYGSTKDVVEFRLDGTSPSDAWFSYSYTENGNDVYYNDDCGYASLSEGTAPQVGNTAYYWGPEQDREIVEVRTFPAQYIEPWVSYTEETSAVTYNKLPVSNEVRSFLNSLPNPNLIVGVMPEFPSDMRGTPGQGHDQKYSAYSDSDGFLVDECPGWGWTTPEQLTDAWFKNMIGSVDWNNVYYWYWSNDHTIYPFRILYSDLDYVATQLPGSDYPTCGFHMRYTDGVLSFVSDSRPDDSDPAYVKTGDGTILGTRRYNEY